MAKLQKKWIADDAIDGSKVKLNNDEYFRARNQLNDADIDLFKFNASDRLEFSELPQYFADPLVDDDLVRKAYVDAQIAASASGLEWQDSVIDILSTPPGSPNTGDRYLVGALATGAWAGDDDEIAEWTGSAWAFTPPTTGMAVLVDDELDGLYIYSGGWSKKGFESTTGGAGTTLNANAIDVNVDGTTIQINGLDALEVKDGGILTSQLGDNAVTSVKITDANVTEAKIASGAVTEAKLGSDVDGESLNISANYATNPNTSGNITVGDSIEDALKRVEAKADGGQTLTSGAATTINGSAIDVDVDDTTIEISGDALQIKALGVSEAQLNANAVTEAKIANSSVTSNKIATGAVTDSELASDAVTSAKILDNQVISSKIPAGAITEAKLGSDVDAESLDVATGYDSSTASGNVAVSDSIQVALEKIEKKADDASSAAGNYNNQIITLSAGDITNGYVELSQEAASGSLQVTPKGGPTQEEGVDYTLSVPASVTRITFAGDLASELAAGDKLMCQYSY